MFTITGSGVDFPGFLHSRETGIFPEFSSFPGNFPGNLSTLDLQISVVKSSSKQTIILVHKNGTQDEAIMAWIMTPLK